MAFIPYEHSFGLGGQVGPVGQETPVFGPMAFGT